MKNILIAVLGLLFSAAGWSTGYPQDLSGTYDCQSTEVGTHVDYHGTTVIKKTGQTYDISSTYNDGSSYQGTGIYSPKMHSLSVIFVNPKLAEETGIAVVDVKKDYTMSSTWTYIHKNEVAQGHCVKRA